MLLPDLLPADVESSPSRHEKKRPPRPLRRKARWALLLPAIVPLVAAACAVEGTVYRVGDPGAPTGPGPFNDGNCEWDDRLVMQRAATEAVTTPPERFVASPELAATTDLEGTFLGAPYAAIAKRADELKATIQWRTSCTVRCTFPDRCGDGPFGFLENCSGTTSTSGFSTRDAGSMRDATAVSEDAGLSIPNDAGTSAPEGEYTTGNNQVSGVDEADFFKNDAKYMHIAYNGAVTTLDAYPGETAAILARTTVDGRAKKVLVTPDRLVVFSSPAADDTVAEECVYGYACTPTGDGMPTTVTVFDTTDRRAPVQLRKVQASGSLLAARRVNDRIHLVVHDRGASLGDQALANFPVVIPSCVTSQEEYDQAFSKIDQAAEAARQAFRKSLRLPTFVDSAGAGVTRSFEQQRPAGQSFLSVLSFSLSDAAPTERAMVLGRPGFVYASDERLYIAQNEFKADCNLLDSSCWFSDLPNEPSATTIHAFSLAKSGQPTSYLASGVVPGTALSGFAMDEFGENLRMLTTSGRVPSPTVHSTLSVLEIQGKRLAVVGHVDDIAPGEDLRSTRFDGTRAMAVTFKTTDPLFTFDLSNPRAPKLAGMLKLPGFATYIHPLDRDHLLTLGFDTEQLSDFANVRGIELKVFDIQNLSDPKVIQQTTVGGPGTTSAALTDHLAFTYLPSKNLLALPMTVCDGQTGAATFQGMYLYDVSLTNGFSRRGELTVDTRSGSCVDADWTQTRTTVSRSAILGDYLYALAGDSLHIARISDLEHPLPIVKLR
jgi:hypothetical protein